MRSSQTKVSVAPGGCPAMWAGQLSGASSRMWSVKPRSVAGMSSKRSMTRRYSCLVVSRRSAPGTSRRSAPSRRPRPWIRPRPPRGALARAAGRRAAGRTRRPGRPWSARRGVPGPRWGSQEARKGGHCANRVWCRSWMTRPMSTAAATSSTPAAAAIRSARARAGRFRRCGPADRAGRVRAVGGVRGGDVLGLHAGTLCTSGGDRAVRRGRVTESSDPLLPAALERYRPSPVRPRRQNSVRSRNRPWTVFRA